MIRADKLSMIHREMLLEVYRQSIEKDGRRLRPGAEKREQLRLGEDAFLSALLDFFREPGCEYAIWEDAGFYRAALRIQPYLDGTLITALETAPDFRRQGFAYRLLHHLCKDASLEGRRLYSHVHVKNHASLQLHLRCGFRVARDTAVLLDGTVSQNYLTLKYEE